MRPANAAGILAAMNINKLHQLYTFILAGGQGERLYPLTQSRPKPAVSFGGLFRMIDFTLSNCLHSMLPEVSILTQYKHEALHRYIREAWSELWNASSRSESLLCLPPVSGKRYRGTADAVFQNLELVPAHSDYVLVLSGDHIYQMNYSDMGANISRRTRTSPLLRWSARSRMRGGSVYFKSTRDRGSSALRKSQCCLVLTHLVQTWRWLVWVCTFLGSPFCPARSM